MAQRRNEKFVDGVFVGTTDTTIGGVVPANNYYTIIKADAVNTSEDSAWVKAHMVPASGVVSDEYIYVPETGVAPKSRVPLAGLVGHTLDPGDYISAIAETADSITLHITVSRYIT